MATNNLDIENLEGINHGWNSDIGLIINTRGNILQY